MLHLIDGKSPYFDPTASRNIKDEPLKKDKLIFKLIKVYDGNKVEDSEDLKIFLGERNKMILMRTGIWDMCNGDFKQIHFKK